LFHDCLPAGKWNDEVFSSKKPIFFPEIKPQELEMRRFKMIFFFVRFSFDPWGSFWLKHEKV